MELGQENPLPESGAGPCPKSGEWVGVELATWPSLPRVKM